MKTFKRLFQGRKVMNKKNYLFVLLSIVFVFNTFAKNPSDRNVFNYYCACVNGDINEVQSFLEKYPEFVDSEMSVSDYQRLANYLIENGIDGDFENDDKKREWKKHINDIHLILHLFMET